MPRKVTAWACKFRCGRKTDTYRKRMERHEERCNKNPKTRACPTCRYDCEEQDDNGLPEPWTRFWTVRYCEIDKRPEKNDKDMECKVVYDCEHWTPRPEGA